MANYAFAIEVGRCIDCHACTVACKVEHRVPVGVNRCWVKSVEHGLFPAARRLFLPVLCNQCQAAPCVAICPTGALFSRPDGIVDLDPARCIGCRACLQACPYDQLFIDPGDGTAEKCNFCANRLERGLLPSCVIVCPTRCRLFGDLDAPGDPVARLVGTSDIRVRKPEKHTRPRVFYVGADDMTLAPHLPAYPVIFREGQVLHRPAAARAEDPAQPGAPRVDYDVPHERPWGETVVAYLATKGISTGTLLISIALWAAGDRSRLGEVGAPLLSLVAMAITGLLLVVDLERPGRLSGLVRHPNWRSWLSRGWPVLTAHGILAAAWALAGWSGASHVQRVLALPAAVVALAATVYTAQLFAQGRGRDFWLRRWSWTGLLAQAGAEGSAALLVLGTLVPAATSAATRSALAAILVVSIALQLALLAASLRRRSSPSDQLAAAAVSRGVFAPAFWGGAVAVGCVAPLVTIAAGAATQASGLFAVAGGLALAGFYAWHRVWVVAGQSVPRS